jgi:hypothetical protein
MLINVAHTCGIEVVARLSLHLIYRMICSMVQWPLPHDMAPFPVILVHYVYVAMIVRYNLYYPVQDSLPSTLYY